MNFLEATINEKNACEQIIHSAFNSYAFFNLFDTNATQQSRFYDQLITSWTSNCFQKGKVLIAMHDETIVGVAVLQSPTDESIDVIDSDEKQTYDNHFGKDSINSFIQMCDVSDKACHALPNPKWHLVLLAVSPKHKGQGIGSKMLLNCIIPYIQKNNGKLLTFNTNDENNRNFYKKNGFIEFDSDILYKNNQPLGNWSYKMFF